MFLLGVIFGLAPWILGFVTAGYIAVGVINALEELER
jgi:membrane protein DedA with SNARE-associated domain